MDALAKIVAVTFVGGLLRALRPQYRAWRIEREQRPDEERAASFWTDRRVAVLDHLDENIFWYWIAIFLALIAGTFAYYALLG